MKTPLQSLAEYGQSAWIEAPPRELAARGRLARLIHEHGISGVVADRSAAAAAELRQICDLLQPVWIASEGHDGYVTSGRHPQALAGLPNVLVEIPPTTEGLHAVEDAVAAGVSVAVTPIFAPERHREAARSYVRGLERLLAHGGDPAAVASVAVIPIASVDAEVDRRLERIGGAATALRGRLAVANARLAYEQYGQVFSGDRWRDLEARGARPQRCVWAGTSPPAGAYPDVYYVEELIGSGTTIALSVAAIEAFEERGIVADRLGRRIEEAHRVVDDISTAGVDLGAVWRTLEAPAQPARNVRR